MNFEQIMEVLENKIDSVSKFAYDEFDQEKLGLGKIEEVAQHGGEGEGSNWYSVKHFVDHDIYIKVSGYYASHYGTDFDGWDDCKEVRPKQQTITVYET